MNGYVRRVAVCICALALVLAGCRSTPKLNNPPDDEQESYLPDKYIQFVVGDRDAAMLDIQINRLEAIYGKTSKEDKVKVAFGINGPGPIFNSTAYMEEKIDRAFDAAKTRRMPVFINIDDMGYSEAGDNDHLFENNPALHEMVSFDGTKALQLFNWGYWAYFDQVPAIGSPTFLAFIMPRIREGIVKPLVRNVAELHRTGDEWLFAGIGIGWETHVKDMRKQKKGGMYPDDWELSNVVHWPDGNNPIQVPLESPYWNIAFYRSIQDMTAGDEIPVTDAASLARRADLAIASGEMFKAGNGWSNEGDDGWGADYCISKTDAFLVAYAWKAVHHYQEQIAKMIFETKAEASDYTIPRHKVFTHIVSCESADRSNSAMPAYSATAKYAMFTNSTAEHPPIWTAVNNYCIPGFTMSEQTEALEGTVRGTTKIYNMPRLKEEIQEAFTRFGCDPVSYFGSIENYASGWRTADQPGGQKHTNPQPASNAQVSTALALFDSYFKPDASYKMECIVHSIYGFNDPKTTAFWCPHDLDDALNLSIRQLKNR